MTLRPGLRPSLALCAMLWATPSARSQVPHNQDRPPNPARSPEEAARTMTVPPGFSVEVVASEPDLINPVAMTFDERGRIWVTESLEYPRSSPGPGRDRIKVMEDTDGDGVMDKFTVFAEGLNIPSGIAVGGGGVWVANAPDILFLRDTDGDGKADRSEVVVTGFGRDDTHELPNSLTWGPDGWLYGLNGVFNRSVVKHRGKTFDFTCALFRIHPRTRAFELFAEGTSNPWGVAWDLDGSAFLSACVIDHLWHLAETGYYRRQGGPYPPFTWPIESIVDYKHHKAAYCGIHYFDSDAYPPEFREKLYMGNIHGNCINVDGLVRDGSTYKGVKHPDFLSANDAWFMPVAQKTGPDGCLYILDWYDRYHCYQDAKRDPEGIDRLKGRLYRVRYEDSPRAPKFDLATEADDRLIERLGSPNVFFRDLAQRLLAERNDAGTGRRLRDLVLSDGPRKARMHALWALVGAGRLDPDFHLALLKQPEPAFRAWGVRAAGNMREVDSRVRAAVLRLTTDPSPDVRLQVAVASRKIRDVEPTPLLLKILAESHEDPLIPRIVWQNLQPMLDDRGRAEAFAATVRSTPASASKNLTRLMPRVVDRLLGTTPPRVDLVNALVAHLDSSAADSEIVAEAEGECLLKVHERVASGELKAADVAGLRDGLAGRLRPILAGPTDDPRYLCALLVATAWKDSAATASAGRFFALDDADPDDRILALGAAVAAGDLSILGPIEEVLKHPGRSTVGFRGRVLAGLGRLDSPRVASMVLAHFAAMEPDLKPKALELLTQRPSWSKALVGAIGAGSISKDSVNLNQVRKLAASKDPELSWSVRSVWGSIREGRDPGRERLIAGKGEMLQEATGDPRAGAAVFKTICAQCHKIYGEGNEVGPDLSSNGRGSFEQLLSNVFDPSLVIGDAYRATTVATVDGRVLSGLLVEDTPLRIVLKMQGGRLETVPRTNVDEVKVGPGSLMPEDIEKQIKPQEIVDLFAFLALDRPPGDPSARPIPGTPARLVRDRPPAARPGPVR